MKLSRIALEEFRKFRQPMALEGLQDGLNLFVGPNEAGKSTVAAAIRSAFLERYSTSKVADLAPHGESGARPSVELEFTHAGHSYVLKKQFLSRARCELLIDGGAQRLDGEEAENALAALLGFELPGRGQSKPDLAGIPGLLWIQQGDGQNLQEAAGHAGAHLREALTQLSGELASGDGDRLYERVAAERGALLDARNGRPKGAYKEAEDALARAAAERDECAQAMAQLNADVDRLAELRRDHERAQAGEPWKDFEAKAAEARARLAALAKEREAFDGLRREQAQAAQTLALLQDQVRRDQQDEAELQALVHEARAARARVEAAREPLARAQQQRQAHAAAMDAARQRVTAVQAVADRRDLEHQLVQLGAEIERLDGALNEVTALIEQGSALKAETMRLEIADADMEALRKRERELANLQLQQQASATRLSYQLEAGGRALLDGRMLSGADEVLLTAAAELELPGVGRLRIEPGGKDLPALKREIDAARAASAALLQRLGVESLAQAEQRHARYGALLRELEGMRKTLGIHAPKGVDVLRGQRDDALARRAQLQERLDKLPAAPAADGGDLPAALQSLREAEAVAAQAETALAAAQRAMDTDGARAQLLENQAAARNAELQSPERAAQRQARAGRLAEARSSHDELERRVRDAQAALAGHRPELVEQDVQRYEKSAAIEREAQHKRHGEILQLQGKLDQAGAQGLGERLSEAEAACERLERRRADFARRAAALELLQKLLADKRAAATQRLQAPLARRLNHYLALLFPEADLRLDDALLPMALRRAGGEDQLSALSFGTREQLGILARFAYADLLREAGRPTLLLLDDALVHTDDMRRDFMKRALFDAATRHQILMFTCHGEAWRDMGVEQRRIA
ncbi:AAA family ATPase [Achromobacter xylosoxidans]|uniref:GTP-binding protein n=1 Tax=Alcaligenes xylosoxydans xylosoxydans TaxID=85698 RepID=A0A424WH02_ALCXX|nr:AAA family ATPase [Achromobacter xylosoxidans]MBC9904300.1 AAA family ATPase [Achromobacter xylosoxidans]MBD0868915.1 AAA family ATPase [Achromobacter xylosoxidans]QNP88750.1 AAA family ATPase [Achromobacter xylosoxidans]RPJ92554.1 GTP-binding protein [Achromobacter xylosoxidans]